MIIKLSEGGFQDKFSGARHHGTVASPSTLLQQAAHLRAGIMADIGPELEQQKELELEAQLKKVWGAGSIV